MDSAYDGNIDNVQHALDRGARINCRGSDTVSKLIASVCISVVIGIWLENVSAAFIVLQYVQLKTSVCNSQCLSVVISISTTQTHASCHLSNYQFNVHQIILKLVSYTP